MRSLCSGATSPSRSMKAAKNGLRRLRCREVECFIDEFSTLAAPVTERGTMGLHDQYQARGTPPYHLRPMALVGHHISETRR